MFNANFIKKIKHYLKQLRFLRSIRNVQRIPANIMGLRDQLYELQDVIVDHQTKLLQSDHPNPLNKFGKKCFSQTDEDGITLEILRRINKIDNGIYAEFGVGDGSENNTLILAALKWKGFWVGGEDIIFRTKSVINNFTYLKEWITLENITSLAERGLNYLKESEIDVISLDLDGNDIYFVEKLLANGFKPKLFIVEYNAKFLPPVKFQIKYDPNHNWQRDDYFGASLSSFTTLFDKYDYRLICCNSHTGSNAFFIHSSLSNFFADIPTDINQIFVGPRYYTYKKYGHKQSIRTIENIFNH